jgi:hypothetical protein
MKMKFNFSCFALCRIYVDEETRSFDYAACMGFWLNLPSAKEEILWFESTRRADFDEWSKSVLVYQREYVPGIYAIVPLREVSVKYFGDVDNLIQDAAKNYWHGIGGSVENLADLEAL